MKKAILVSSSIAAVLCNTLPAVLAAPLMVQAPLLAQSEPMNITSEQLDKFANAARAVSMIQEQEMYNFVDLMEKANTLPGDFLAFVSAVNATGLTIQEALASPQAEQLMSIAKIYGPDRPDGTSTGLLPPSPELAQILIFVYEKVLAGQNASKAEQHAAIQAQGLTIAEYEQIYAMVQKDPALEQQILQRLKNLPCPGRCILKE